MSPCAGANLCNAGWLCSNNRILLALLQENAARLKAYKAKLVIFPKRSNKPKSGDSSAEDTNSVPQHKGTILPLVHEKPKLETIKLTDELKVTPQILFMCSENWSSHRTPEWLWSGILQIGVGGLCVLSCGTCCILKDCKEWP